MSDVVDSAISDSKSRSVPVGYKLTEVGLIPADWEVKPIADLVEPTAPVCYGVVQVGPHTENGVPIIAIKFVKEIAHAALHRTEQSLERPYLRSRPQCGDVLISIKGTIGRVGIVPDGFNGNISRELARIRIGKANCGEYVAHQLEADATQDRIIRSVVGTTRLEFSIATLRQFQVPVPSSKAEQQEIAAALSDVDALLGALERLIAKKRDLKQAAMQQLLTGQTRLPGFHGQWEEKRFCDIGILSKGKGLLKEDIKRSGSIPAIPYTALYTDYSEVVDFRLIKWFIDDESQTVIVREPCLLFASSSNMEANTGKASALVGTIPVAIGREIIIFKTSSDCKFISYLLSTESYRRKTLMLARGTTIKHIYPATLQSYHVAIPPLPEQTAIAEVLSDMDAEIAALEQRREKTRALKQGMMQELLTGKTRLMPVEEKP